MIYSAILITMHWPEYDSTRRSGRQRPWLVLLLAAVVLGLAFAGAINGWWSLPFLSASSSDAQPTPGESPASVPVAAQARQKATSATGGDQAQAPLFALADLFDASLARRLDDYAGQPVILNFWASWCVPCRIEMPALQQAYDNGRQAGLVVLGVNETYIDSLDAAQEFYRELALTFPAVRDDTGITSEMKYQIIGLPTTVFISPEGQIVHRHIGQMTEDQVRRYSQQLIASQPVGK